MISKRRKLSLSVIAASALCVLAFAAIPAMASAAQLFEPSGVSTPVGTKLTLSSTNATWETNGSAISCEKWEFVGTVSENTGSVVKVLGATGEDKAKGCAGNGGLIPLEIKPKLESIVLSPTVNQAIFQFSLPALGLVQSSTSTVTYTAPAKIINVAGLVTGSWGGKFTADFTIANHKGGSITVK